MYMYGDATSTFPVTTAKVAKPVNLPALLLRLVDRSGGCPCDLSVFVQDVLLNLLYFGGSSIILFDE